MNIGLILRYAKYIPLLIELIGFIRAAERAFRGAPGRQKLDVVAEQLVALVTTLEAGGIVPKALARAIREGAAAIISIIVQAMNAEQGGVADGDNTGNPDVGVAGPYLKVLAEYPARKDYSRGDVVWQHGDDMQWMVTQKGVGVGKPAAPWREVGTFE